MLNVHPTKRTSSSLFSPLVEQAIELSAQWHDGTYRKGTWREAAFYLPDQQAPRTPAMFHLTAVAFSVQQAGWDPVTVAASFLHDILEDPNRFGDRFSKNELERVMGTEVTRIVDQLTEKKVDAEGNPRSWRQRKEEYLEAAISFSPEAVAICLADKHHNLWSMNQSLTYDIDIFRSTNTRKGLNSGPAEQLWFFSRIVECTSSPQDRRLFSLRDQLVKEINRFSSLLLRKDRPVEGG